MKGTTTKGRQPTQVPLFLCVVFISTFCQMTFSTKLNQTFPTPFAEESSTQLVENITRTHKLKSENHSTSKIRWVQNSDTTSNTEISETAKPTAVHVTFFLQATATEAPQENFPLDLLPVDDLRKGWVILHMIGLIYMFASLVFVCDKFFIPAVGVTAETLRLSDDVAGASVMAAGRSSPKLLAIIIGLFLTHSNVRFGSVVGPALYNVVFVPGVCALLARDVVSLSQWPLYRDVSFYLLGFILLIVFFLDGVIHWGESIVLVSVYTLYVLFMKFNTQIEHGIKIHMGRRWRTIPGNKHEKEDSPACQDGLSLSDCTGTDETDEKARGNSCKYENDESRVEETNKEEKPVSLKWPNTGRKQIIYVLLLPIVLPLWLTLPDVRNEKNRKFFILTFVGSSVWIAVFLYLIVWWGHQVGDIVGIPEPIMALLVAGAANADLITSVIVARKGLGNMAVSSCIGSNILDITIYLPVSWFLYSSIHGSASVDVDSSGIICASTLLLFMLLSTIISIAACRWKMNKVLGCVLVLLYFIFVVISIMLQYGFIICPVSDGK
ncbi:sodium/potassium/calcium exchanger 1-like [Gouania willdenowi]|uniref:sodium/potassium/calcium exchanger 1-like n=1 Tax=Gouania willdenowi TaxID=441366 RepID=UPI0010552424|nr:sodium/potassium/calcium exchanger 1-like [Gouania willdenowi]XP_028305346.1 sodium/potassium/calcium exchanger 1-like [Gouania willdenowi]